MLGIVLLASGVQRLPEFPVLLPFEPRTIALVAHRPTGTSLYRNLLANPSPTGRVLRHHGLCRGGYGPGLAPGSVNPVGQHRL